MVFYYGRSASDRDFSPKAPQQVKNQDPAQAGTLIIPHKGGLDMASGVLRQLSALAAAAAVVFSGLIAGFGVRDNNELSWSQIVDHVGFALVEEDRQPVAADLDVLAFALFQFRQLA